VEYVPSPAPSRHDVRLLLRLSSHLPCDWPCSGAWRTRRLLPLRTLRVLCWHSAVLLRFLPRFLLRWRGDAFVEAAVDSRGARADTSVRIAADAVNEENLPPSTEYLSLEGKRCVVGGMLKGDIQLHSDLRLRALCQRGNSRACHDIKDIGLYCPGHRAPADTCTAMMLARLE